MSVLRWKMKFCHSFKLTQVIPNTATSYDAANSAKYTWTTVLLSPSTFDGVGDGISSVIDALGPHASDDAIQGKE